MFSLVKSQLLRFSIARGEIQPSCARARQALLIPQYPTAKFQAVTPNRFIKSSTGHLPRPQVLAGVFRIAQRIGVLLFGQTQPAHEFVKIELVKQAAIAQALAYLLTRSQHAVRDSYSTVVSSAVIAKQQFENRVSSKPYPLRFGIPRSIRMRAVSLLSNVEQRDVGVKN